MKLNRIKKTVSLAASALMLGATGVMSVNAADTFCAAWITGISRDAGARGQALQLGDHLNTREGLFYAHYAFPNWCHQKLSDVKKIRASFLTPLGTVNNRESPRFTLAVENADGTPLLDDNLQPIMIYLDPAFFNDATVGWRDCDFTGDTTDCSIFDSRGTRYTSDGVRSAWSKLISDPYYAGKKVGLLSLVQNASTGPNFVDCIRLDNTIFTKAP